MHSVPGKQVIVTLVLSLLLVLPVYGVLLTAGDTLLGSRQLADQVLFESRSALLYQMLSDARQSLPFALPAALVTTLILYSGIRSGVPGLFGAITLVALLCLVPLSLLNFAPIQSFLFVATLLLTALCAVLLSRRLCHAR